MTMLPKLHTDASLEILFLTCLNTLLKVMVIHHCKIRVAFPNIYIEVLSLVKGASSIGIQ